jgi:hypothetical protein
VYTMSDRSVESLTPVVVSALALHVMVLDAAE